MSYRLGNKKFRELWEMDRPNTIWNTKSYYWRLEEELVGLRFRSDDDPIEYKPGSQKAKHVAKLQRYAARVNPFRRLGPDSVQAITSAVVNTAIDQE